MKITYSILFLIISLESISQGSSDSLLYYNDNFNREFEREYARFYGVPLQISDNRYEVTFYTFSGRKIATGHFINNKFKHKEGRFNRYNAKGNLVFSTNYVKNLMHGNCMIWHENGQLSDSGRIEWNLPVGKWKTWYPSGQLQEIINYRSGQRAESHFKEYHYYMLENEYISWYENGHLKDSGYYKNGFRDGVWTEWIQDGTVRSVGFYKKGWKKGDWKYYDTTGKLLFLRRLNQRHLFDKELVIPFD